MMSPEERQQGIAGMQTRRIKLLDELKTLRVKKMKMAGRNFAGVHMANLQKEIEEKGAELRNIERMMGLAKETA